MSTLLATRLKSKRLELGVSQKELAEGVCAWFGSFIFIIQKNECTNELFF